MDEEIRSLQIKYDKKLEDLKDLEKKLEIMKMELSNVNKGIASILSKGEAHNNANKQEG
jgi:Skp family chaperone for outer membrane proteins